MVVSASSSTASRGARAGQRTGESPVERRALNRLRAELDAMPASLVVQIALWPDKLADWADEQGIDSSVVYNCLGGHKPYHRVRKLLARRLGVEKEDVDELIEAETSEPHSRQPPADPPPASPAPETDTGGAEAPPRAPDRASEEQSDARASRMPTTGNEGRQPAGDEHGQMQLSIVE